jgi:hypothetical protein
VYGSVAFDDADQLSSITLKSSYPREPEATDAVVLAAANRVMTALGIEALPALPASPTAWKQRTTHVTFEWDGECFWFELSPGPRA